MASVKKMVTCEKVGCKETDLGALGSFGRTVRLCEERALSWQNCEEARALGRKSRLLEVAVDAHVNAGRAEEAQRDLVAMFAQEDEGLKFFDAWLKRIG